jgi:pimeloyl-ACP methyl ester carboxylesterase
MFSRTSIGIDASRQRRRADVPSLNAVGRTLEYRWIPARRSIASSAPALVFLHSALGSARLWDSFPDRLAERTGRGALVYSRQGHGSSGPLPPQHDADYLDQEALVVLPAVLADRGVTNPVLIGHSDGATIALIAAARSDVAFQALVLIAPHVIVEDISIRGIDESKVAYETKDLREKLSFHHDDVDGMFQRWVNVWRSESFRAWSIVPLLPSITCPTLVIQGENDRYGTLEQLNLLEENIGGSIETLVLADCGHAPQVDHPDIVLDAMTEFCRQLQSE